MYMVNEMKRCGRVVYLTLTGTMSYWRCHLACAWPGERLGNDIDVLVASVCV